MDLSGLPPQPPAFGSKEMRRLFLLDDDFVATNHGSFGATPKFVLDAKIRHLLKSEANPEKYFRTDFQPNLDAALLPVCRFVGLPSVESCVFVPNATWGVNAVLRSLTNILKANGQYPSSKRQRILCFTSVYASVLKAIQFVCDKDNFKSVVVNVPYPISHTEFLQLASAAVNENTDETSEVVLAVFDMISSVPGVINPFVELTTLFKERGILTCIDGAHAIGQIPFSLAQWKPDFLVTNLHKWLYVPRGCALFYADKKFHSTIRPAVISEHDPLDWRRGFMWQGTMDISGFLCTKEALAFREYLGGEQAIQDYSHKIAIRGAEIIARKLGTSVMRLPQNDAHALHACMVNVRVPTTQRVLQIKTGVNRGEGLERALLDRNAFVALFQYNNEFWLRVSGQVYLNEKDFERVADILYDVLGVGSAKL